MGVCGACYRSPCQCTSAVSSDRAAEAIGVPSGYVLIPTSLWLETSQDAQRWRDHVRSMGPPGIPMGVTRREGLKDKENR